MPWFYAGKLCTFEHLSSLSITQHLPHCYVKEWIRKERLKFFCKTDLFLQYLLCAYLQEGCETSSKMFLCPWHTTIISDDFKFLCFFHRFHATRRVCWKAPDVGSSYLNCSCLAYCMFPYV